MRIYEKILSILEEKGTLTVPLICKEVNHLLPEREKPLLPSQVKSIVARKKDLFHVKNGNIMIHPDKSPQALIATLDNENGMSLKVKIDFSKKLFIYFEWRNRGIFDMNLDTSSRNFGDLDSFKKEIYALKIWEWAPIYGHTEGITIGKINWNVQLITAGKTYFSEGTDCYPENWHKFCKAIEKLTGTIFCH